MVKWLTRPELSVLMGLAIGVVVATPALASPGVTTAKLRANVANLYAIVTANAAELRANVGP